MYRNLYMLFFLNKICSKYLILFIYFVTGGAGIYWLEMKLVQIITGILNLLNICNIEEKFWNQCTKEYILVR